MLGDVDQLGRKASGRTLVMGVLNVTPDSFSDGGDYADPAAAIARGFAMVEEGADIVDVGGESTRPGAKELDAETEASRVLGVVRSLAGAPDILVSIDTYKAAVAEAALKAGARIVNDVGGLRREPDIARVAAAHGAAVVIGHWEKETRYGPATILDAMLRFFDRSIATARAAGVPDHRILLDPGIGFGKDIDENLVILDRLDRIVALDFPVVIGTSRKRFIGALTGREPRDRLFGTIATHVLAVERGASIVRAHDVAPHRDALVLVDAILGSRNASPVT